jgi:hypothetical protein
MCLIGLTLAVAPYSRGTFNRLDFITQILAAHNKDRGAENANIPNLVRIISFPSLMIGAVHWHTDPTRIRYGKHWQAGALY